MNALDAALTVLDRHGGPLHYREITRLVLEWGLWKTEGETPDATINARLSRDLKRRDSNSDFVRNAPGVYELCSRNPDDGRTSTGGVVRCPGTMSFTDAAEHVLDNLSNHRPLHYREITDVALAKGIVVTWGKTPEATLYAQVLTEIKRRTRRGGVPRFVKHGRGYIGLRKWVGSGLAFQIERHNADVREALLARFHKVTPTEFEAVVGRLLVALGFEDVIVTKVSADGGTDVRGVRGVGDAVRIWMAVQAKRWKKNVQEPTVQSARGALGAHEQGLIITTSGFSKGARTEAAQADKSPIGLMDGGQLVGLLVENDIGVARAPYDLLDLAPLGIEADDEDV